MVADRMNSIKIRFRLSQQENPQGNRLSTARTASLLHGAFYTTASGRISKSFSALLLLRRYWMRSVPIFHGRRAVLIALIGASPEQGNFICLAFQPPPQLAPLRRWTGRQSQLHCRALLGNQPRNLGSPASARLSERRRAVFSCAGSIGRSFYAGAVQH